MLTRASVWKWVVLTAAASLWSVAVEKGPGSVPVENSGKVSPDTLDVLVFIHAQ